MVENVYQLISLKCFTLPKASFRRKKVKTFSYLHYATRMLLRQREQHAIKLLFVGHLWIELNSIVSIT